MPRTDLFLYAGNTGTLEFSVTDDSGLPYDLTLCTLSFAAVGGQGSISKTTAGGGIVVTDVVGGLGNVLILPADTAGWADGTLGWHLDVTTAGGDVYTVIEGFLTVIQPEGGA